MEYLLKKGRTVNIRPPCAEDAAQLVQLITQVDSETRFLAREPGEFDCTEEQERQIIAEKLNDPAYGAFVAELEGKIVGQASVCLMRPGRARYRHRAQMAIAVLREYWGMGIGGRLMQEVLGWARQAGASQIELDVVRDNERAIRLYTDFGFRITGELPNALHYADGTFADEYYMVKPLGEGEICNPNG